MPETKQQKPTQVVVYLEDGTTESFPDAVVWDVLDDSIALDVTGEDEILATYQRGVWSHVRRVPVPAPAEAVAKEPSGWLKVSDGDATSPVDVAKNRARFSGADPADPSAYWCHECARRVSFKERIKPWAAMFHHYDVLKSPASSGNLEVVCRECGEYLKDLRRAVHRGSSVAENGDFDVVLGEDREGSTVGQGDADVRPVQDRVAGVIGEDGVRGGHAGQIVGPFSVVVHRLAGRWERLEVVIDVSGLDESDHGKPLLDVLQDAMAVTPLRVDFEFQPLVDDGDGHDSSPVVGVAPSVEGEGLDSDPMARGAVAARTGIPSPVSGGAEGVGADGASPAPAPVLNLWDSPWGHLEIWAELHGNRRGRRMVCVCGGKEWFLESETGGYRAAAWLEQHDLHGDAADAGEAEGCRA